MDETNIYKLENNIDYMEIDSINYKNNKYVLLSNINNSKDVCIRKVGLDNYIYRLDNNELNEVINLFIKENKI